MSSENFRRITTDFNVQPLSQRLTEHPELFGLYDFRASAYASPHTAMRDIWVRYKDVRPHLESGDFSGFADAHDPIWYPVAEHMPEVFPLVFKLMSLVKGERLGGVLITRLPPGGRIEPHVDRGWHAEHYDKYYVPIQNGAGATFNFPDGVISPTLGEVYWFRNDRPHWVINGSDSDRIAMIVCIKPWDRYGEHSQTIQRTQGHL